MSPALKQAALALPILLLVFMVGRAEWQLAHSQTWHFAIRGYDPRDLLKGHYMRFQLSVSLAETIDSCSVRDPDCCYCLEPGEGTEPQVAIATCETARSTCDAFVRTVPLHALDRFYIPEEGRRQMEQTLRTAARDDRAQLAVAVSRTGEPMIEALLVGGVPIRAAAAAEAAEAEAAGD